MSEALPIAIIGGGPVGLAAASHALARGLPVKLYEAGATVAANLLDWGHVRVFTPWELNVDRAARTLLERHGWVMPPLAELPIGADLYGRYLKPLAETPELRAVIELGAWVDAISRRGADKMMSKGREDRTFALRIMLANGDTRIDLASAVVDASGTWANPSPIGANGLPARGELQNQARIAYGVPDVLGRDRDLYADRRTLVLGAGYSAANVLLDLARLAGDCPRTSVLWATRGTDLIRVYGGGLADQLPARGELGWRLQALVESKVVALMTGFAATAVSEEADGIVVEGETEGGLRRVGPVDRIVVATGQRPDLAMTRELRLDLDPWLESVRALGPMIDPNVHSCGDVPPHGHRELSHPEPGFYTVGVKSYGRAPTFLLLTGYEQARSVMAAIAGDMVAADQVQLVLPETGVCKVEFMEEGMSAVGCCGGPSTVKDACCVADAMAKQEGGERLRLRIGRMSGMLSTDPPATAPSRHFAVVISALGVAQIFAWGSSYYLLAVLAKPIARDTGWPLPWIVAGISLGLLAAGLISPRIGKLISRHGGRPVLAVSAMLLSAGLGALGFAHSIPTYLIAWVIIGIGMGSGLYDPAFATLGRLYGEGARPAITTLTLFGGFASTVCWPLPAFLVTHLGWRGTCWVYAAFHLLVLVPVYLCALPKEKAAQQPERARRAKPASSSSGSSPNRLLGGLFFCLLATVITVSSMISTLLSVHLLTILQSRGVGLAAAVGLGALVGPSQVGARTIEFFIARYHHPIWTKLVSTMLVVIGVAALWVSFPILALPLVFYGAGIGSKSIARGTLPLVLFPGLEYAVTMGRLAMPSLIAQAAAPSIGAFLFSTGGANGVLSAVTAVAGVNFTLAIVIYVMLKRHGMRRPGTATAAA